MTINDLPTMEGFHWSPTASGPAGGALVPGENGWCVRDAVCALLGWEPGSPEWARFNEWPAGKDVRQLFDHLGLTEFDLEGGREWNDLVELLRQPDIDYPAVAWYIFDRIGRTHLVYVPSVRWLLHYWPIPDGPPRSDQDATRDPGWPGWPLTPEHLIHEPKLVSVALDTGRSLPLASCGIPN